MSYRNLRICLIACAMSLAAPALAQPPSPQPPGAVPPPPRQEPPERPQPPLPLPGRSQMIDVEGITARLAREIGKDFAVDPRARGLAGTITAAEIDYPSFISLMRVNAFAVIEGEDVIYVVPDVAARFYGTPIVQRDDADVHPSTIVTRVITTSADAPQLLGILRPLADQSAVMSVSPPNKIVIVDRYENVKRIAEVVRLLEQR
jgi:type II secretory pathway component GspD/PulD (secretin)